MCVDVCTIGFWLRCIVLPVLLASMLGQAEVARANLRPNVVVIMTDDHRADSVGPAHALGQVVMPNVISRIADEGLSFERAFAPNPACGPARASFLSGLHSHHSGVPRNGTYETFDPSESLATWLSDSGYHTALLGKYINGFRPYIVAPGWTSWFVGTGNAYFDYTYYEQGVRIDYGSTEEEHRTDVLAARAVHEIANAPEPFFVFLAMLAPHKQSVPAPRHAGSYAAAPDWRPPSFNEADVSDKPPGRLIRGLRSDNVVEAGDVARIAELETLQTADDAVGSVLDALEARGSLDDTLVVFLSDNGKHWGEHRLYGKKTGYEESIQIPMMVRYPPLVAAPRTDDQLVSLLDLTATILDLAGATPTHPIDGDSLVPLLDGSAETWRDRILLEGSREGFWWAGVRTAEWKLIEFADGARELYDLVADPHELENLAGLAEHAQQETLLAADIRALRPGFQDLDVDGVPDDVDVCPFVADPHQLDTDGDGVGNECQYPDCSDGIDNDLDGTADFDGGQSIFGPCLAGVCPAGVTDIDQDGVADVDPTCPGPAWQSEKVSKAYHCGLGFGISLVLVGWVLVRRRRRTGLSE